MTSRYSVAAEPPHILLPPLLPLLRCQVHSIAIGHKGLHLPHHWAKDPCANSKLLDVVRDQGIITTTTTTFPWCFLTLLRCQARSIGHKGLHLPHHWPKDPDFKWFKAQGTQGAAANGSGGGGDGGDGEGEGEGMEETTVQDSLLLMKMYELSSRLASTLCAASQGASLEGLFKLTPLEADIVQYGK